MSCYSCLSPVTVTNAFGTFKVPCGKCDACLNQKGSNSSRNCSIESLYSKYTYFVTLTYDNETVPLARCFKHDDRVILVNASPRCSDTDPILQVDFHSNFDINMLPLYYDKFHLPYYGYIPYLRKRDAQLFLKRLRSKLKYYYNEKVRYYLCGEYGPRTFRPHYHLLLFFESDQIAQNLGAFVRQAWPYGRIDCQKSKGKTSNYVAKYVNSSFSLSRLHKFKAIRPFSQHSVRFGQQIYEGTTKEIYEVGYDEFASRGFVSNGRFERCFPTLAIQSRFFPKCFCYGQADGNVRFLLYTLYARIQEELGYELRVSECVEKMWLSRDSFYKGECVLPCFREFWSIFGDAYLNKLISHPITEETLKGILYTSSKFLKLCKNYDLTPYALLKSIDLYYSEKDMSNLNKQLQEQSEFIDTYGIAFLPYLLYWYGDFIVCNSSNIQKYNEALNDLDSMYFSGDISRSEYDRLALSCLDSSAYYPEKFVHYMNSINVLPAFYNDETYRLYNNPAYRSFSDLQKKIAVDSVKHKVLNDLNQIFCYG